MCSLDSEPVIKEFAQVLLDVGAWWEVNADENTAVPSGVDRKD
jgi:hypothetical protein